MRCYLIDCSTVFIRKRRISQIEIFVNNQPLPMTHEPGGVAVIPMRNEPEALAGRSSSGDDRDTPNQRGQGGLALT